jgi:hypothetical protein
MKPNSHRLSNYFEEQERSVDLQRSPFNDASLIDFPPVSGFENCDFVGGDNPDNTLVFDPNDPRYFHG